MSNKTPVTINDMLQARAAAALLLVEGDDTIIDATHKWDIQWQTYRRLESGTNLMVWDTKRDNDFQALMILIENGELFWA